jgi:hypothetical protein
MLRERTTSMVFQTTGVLVGLLGFKEGKLQDNHIGIMAALFIVLLGSWGLFSSTLSELRIEEHHRRIEDHLKALDPEHMRKSRKRKTMWVWLGFHSGIVISGSVLLVITASANPYTKAISEWPYLLAALLACGIPATLAVYLIVSIRKLAGCESQSGDDGSRSACSPSSVER